MQDQMNSVIWFADPQNIIVDTQNHHPMCFSPKAMTKMAFSGNGGKHNVAVNEFVQTTKDFSNLKNDHSLN